MKRKTIDTLREIRLWGERIVIPLCIMSIAKDPDLRRGAIELGQKTKNKVMEKVNYIKNRIRFNF